MRARGKGVGISFKIALIFMILSGAFWIILFIQFYYSSDQEAKEYVESLSEQAMSSISKNIEMIIGNVSFHSRQILSNGDLIHSLKELRDMGNSVIVVEHDKDMMLAADYVIDEWHLYYGHAGSYVQH